MANRRNLTPVYINSLKPAPKGQRVDHHDVAVPGLAVRVTDSGAKAFVLIARFPSKPKHPTRRSIGNTASMPLGDARKIARKWLEMISEGIDPQQQIAERKQVAAEGPLTFGAAFERWKNEQLDRQRRGGDVASNFKRELLPRWKDKPLASIARRDCRDACMAVAERGHLGMAGVLLNQTKRFFTWAMEACDLENHPAISIKGSVLFGPRAQRDRTPTDTQLRAIWNAAESLDYPAQPFIRMMILSGQRRNQVAGMRWREIDKTNNTWTVPRERMKMGRPFTLPLSPQMIALLDTLPRFSEGDHVFSTTNGKKPWEAFDIMKKALDARLPDVAHWTLHDLRRSMRSTMSRLRINHDVAEACLSHDKIGLHKIYDTHDLIDEKRDAMQAWERHLRSIIAPTPDNVVRLRA